MTAVLHLTITTTMEVVVDAAVSAVRAEDESGAFGILPGHTDLLTALPASVVRWRNGSGVEHYCGIRAGVLSVTEGARVAIACRDAILSDDLQALEDRIRALRHDQQDADRQARVEQTRLHADAVRQMMRLLRPDRPGGIAHPEGFAATRHGVGS